MPGHEFISTQSLTRGVPLRWVDGLVPLNGTPLRWFGGNRANQDGDSPWLCRRVSVRISRVASKWCLRLRTAAAAEFKQGVPEGCDWLGRPTTEPQATCAQLADLGIRALVSGHQHLHQPRHQQHQGVCKIERGRGPSSLSAWAAYLGMMPSRPGGRETRVPSPEPF